LSSEPHIEVVAEGEKMHRRPFSSSNP
jgi:hypothetical protein